MLQQQQKNSYFRKKAGENQLTTLLLVVPLVRQNPEPKVIKQNHKLCLHSNPLNMIKSLTYYAMFHISCNKQIRKATIYSNNSPKTR